MEFFERTPVDENPEKVYWSAYKDSLDEKYTEFQGRAEIFREDFVRPIECDYLSETAAGIKEFYALGRDQADVDPFVHFGRSKPYELLMYAHSGEATLEGIIQVLKGYRSICSTSTPGSRRIRENILDRLSNFDRNYRSFTKHLQDLINTIV